MKLATYALALLPLAALAVLGSSCSAGDESGGYDTQDAAPSEDVTSVPPPKDSGQDAAKAKDSGHGGGSDATTNADGSDDDGSTADGTTPDDTSTPSDGGPETDAGWVDMNSADGAANPTACDNMPGVPCGWSATNNGLGYTCRCANPTWADPWGCEAPDSGAPEVCPLPDAGNDSSTAMDSSSGDGSSGADSGIDAGEDSGKADSGTITDAQSFADAWVDMNSADGAANPHACDNEPGAPCGWSTTNNGLGYTCRCVNPTWADPWGCEPPDSGIPAACP
jgi:hypothetical protein